MTLVDLAEGVTLTYRNEGSPPETRAEAVAGGESLTAFRALCEITA